MQRLMMEVAPQRNANATADLREGGRWTLAQRAKNALLFRIVRAGMWLADHLPSAWLPALGRSFGSIAHALLHNARRTARTNLALWQPDRCVAPLARATFRCAGENLAHCLRLRRAEFRVLDHVAVSAETRSTIARALADKRGGVLVSAHLGPFEWVAAALVKLGFPLVAVVRESYDPRLDSIVDAHRVARGVEVIHRGAPGAAIRIVRAIRHGKLVAFLPDLGGRVRSRPGVLLGQPVNVPLGPTRIAARTGAPLLVASLGRNRQDGGPDRTGARFSLTAELLPPGTECDLERAVDSALTERISALAEHWLWMAPRFPRLQRDRARH